MHLFYYIHVYNAGLYEQLMLILSLLFYVHSFGSIVGLFQIV